MRILIWVLVLGAIGWSGYWYVASSGAGRGLEAWLDARAAEGWQAEGTVETTGFPTTFDTAITDIALADPETGLAWSAPELRLTAQAWAPTSVKARLPGTQTVSTPYERIEIESDEILASLSLEPGADLTLIASEITMRSVVLASSADWTAALKSGVLGSQRAGSEALAHDIKFETRDFKPSGSILLNLDPTGTLPDVFEELTVRARITFDAPWDRRAIEDRRPQITYVDLSGIRARWGQMEFQAAGEVAVDGNGVPDGRITVRAVNWREMLAIGEAAGFVPEALAPTIERGLEVLAGLRGNPETIDAPLSFQDGFVSFGPIPLGPAPNLTIR
ncbi:MAG: DUF2125 domain-containing protein [Pseudomonadota bacterium]